ncbi:hypothetical protein Tco_0733978 [Tanacetum coccineum]
MIPATFWGANDEEISEGGIPWVIVLGYDGLPMQPVALPSPDYIPGPEDPQTPPVPQDEDDDEHEFLAEEQPLPHVDSPTAGVPGYLLSRIPRRIQRSTRMMRQRMGRSNYPGMGEMMEMMMTAIHLGIRDRCGEDDRRRRKSHLAPTDSAVVVPLIEPVFPTEGTEPVIPPHHLQLTILLVLGYRPP